MRSVWLANVFIALTCILWASVSLAQKKLTDDDDTLVSITSISTSSSKILKADGKERAAIPGEVLYMSDDLLLEREVVVILGAPDFDPRSLTHFSGLARQQVNVGALIAQKGLKRDERPGRTWSNVIKSVWDTIFEVPYKQGTAQGRIGNTHSLGEDCGADSILGCIVPPVPVTSTNGTFEMVWPACSGVTGEAQLRAVGAVISPSSALPGRAVYSDLQPGQYDWEIAWGLKESGVNGERSKGTLEVLDADALGSLRAELETISRLPPDPVSRTLTEAAFLAATGALLDARRLLTEAASAEDPDSPIHDWRQGLIFYLASGIPDTC
ncbi:hypothetical protein QO034_21500 [Sedimentitalea sp. JM2-8]|uniref:Uncharacterized protein n=1 Tax=Sedimentitalea xiamensis TaxID=3050037 RepID=A0ABT7FKF5_9RHOB|nr:hypothetical protein [Sedimentitalea xiamensis]MDK3075646.1 hypothetical protein [Sedimentitalea xiamensis]